LQTPIFRTSPAETNSSIARHVSAIGTLAGFITGFAASGSANQPAG
jgi:hypothetical protein